MNGFNSENPLFKANVGGHPIVIQYTKPISEGFRIQHVGTLVIPIIITTTIIT